MENLLTPSNITFVLGIAAIVFAIYHYFKNPQIDTEKRDALMDQQLRLYMESSDRRFAELQASFKDLVLQSNNHVHTVDTKVEALHGIVIGMGQEIAKLGTIIEERVPKKFG